MHTYHGHGPAHLHWFEALMMPTTYEQFMQLFIRRIFIIHLREYFDSDVPYCALLQSVGAAKAVSWQGLYWVVCQCLRSSCWAGILEFWP